MELLIQSLKLEVEEKEKEEEEKNIIKLQDIVAERVKLIDDYEPDYYEEQ